MHNDEETPVTDRPETCEIEAAKHKIMLLHFLIQCPIRLRFPVRV